MCSRDAGCGWASRKDGLEVCIEIWDLRLLLEGPSSCECISGFPGEEGVLVGAPRDKELSLLSDSASADSDCEVNEVDSDCELL